MAKLMDIFKNIGRHTSDDVVKAYLEIEAQIPGYEAAIKDAETKAKQLRKSKIAGENVSSADLDSVDRILKDAELTLKAAVDMMQDLKGSFENAVRSEDESNEAVARETKDKAESLRGTEREECIKAAANYKAHYLRVRNHMDDDLVQGESFQNPDAFIFRKEVERRSAELNKKYGVGIRKAYSSLQDAANARQGRNISAAFEERIAQLRSKAQ
jgi:hypothetical protein